MRGVPEDDELEIVPVDGAPPVPPTRSPTRDVAAWAGRHTRLLLAVTAALALVGTTHAVLAVRGLRALERHTREAVVLRGEYDAFVSEVRGRSSSSYRFTGEAADDRRIARATADYGARVAQLADRTRGVFVLDPRLTRLRRGTARLLEGEARRARAAGAAFLAPYGVHQAAIQVAQKVESWGLGPGAAPRPPPLAAVEALRGPAPLLDERTDSRLFLVDSGAVHVIEVDTGTVARLGPPESLGPWAVADGFVGIIDFGEGRVAAFGRSGRGRSVGRYDEVVAHADDPGLLWFVTRPLDGGDTRPAVAHAFDREGVRRDEVALGRDDFLGAASSRWLVRTRFGQHEGISFTVADRRRNAVVAAEKPAGFFGLRGDVLAWTDDRRLLVRTLPSGEDRVVAPPRSGLVPVRALLSRDARRLAVVWVRPGNGPIVGAQVAVHDVDSGRVVAMAGQETDGFPTPAWSGRGDWLFVLEGTRGTDARLLAWREGLPEPKPLAIEGQFHGLAAF